MRVSPLLFYTHAQLKKTMIALRLLPPSPVSFRQALKDTSLPVGGSINRDSPIHVGKGDLVA